MNSVERYWEYNSIATEALDPDEGIEPPEDWPSKGKIEFENYSFKYRSVSRRRRKRRKEKKEMKIKK